MLQLLATLDGLLHHDRNAEKHSADTSFICFIATPLYIPNAYSIQGLTWTMRRGGGGFSRFQVIKEKYTKIWRFKNSAGGYVCEVRGPDLVC